MRCSVKKFLAGLMLACSLGVAATAQSPINLTSFTVREGLSSNTVNAITKDRFGLMWFGTTNGLSRFDGSNFVNYRHDPKNPYSLPTNDVMSLLEDHTGRLWLGLSGGGVLTYDPKFNRFLPYKGNGSWTNIVGISVKAMLEDHRHMIWVATYGDLRIINPKTGQINQLIITGSNRDLMRQLVVLALYEDTQNRMWIGTNSGLFLYDFKKQTFARYTHHAEPGSISGDIVKSITEDNAGNIWVGTYSGLNKYEGAGKFKVYRHNANVADGLSNDAIFSISKDGDGKIWIGTEEGVNLFDPQAGTFQVLRRDPRNAFSIRSNSIRSFYFDKRGVQWIGTFNGGVSKYDKHLALLNLKQSNPFDPAGLKSPFVTSFAEYKKGKIFIGTDGGGLQMFDQHTGLMSSLKLKSKLAQTGKEMPILALCLDSKGMLWASAYHHGLFCIDPVTGQYEQFINDGTARGISKNEITAIVEDQSGKIWVGTLGQGVDVYDPEKRTFERFSSKNKLGDAYPPLTLNDYINSLVLLPGGDVAIGSMGAGLAIYHPHTRTYNFYSKENSALADNVISNMVVTRDRTLWIGTNDGICSFDPRNSKFITYSEPEGLANSYIKTVLEDDNGLIWMSTDRGISSFDRAKKIFRNLTAENGVQQGSFMNGSGIKASNGEIFFGGQDGFNYFNPSALPVPPNPGRVLLTQLKVNNDAVTPEPSGAIKEQISMAREITLHYGQNFSLDYVAVDYSNPKQNLYAYRLKGYDRDWNYVHRARSASYTNMDPGTYTFQVKASNKEHQWNTPVTEVKILILPPIWRTKTAYGLYALGFVGGLFLIRRRGIRKLRKEFAEQQEKDRVKQLVAEERKQAERLHELDLLKIRFLTDLSHEFRTPISLVLAPVEKLLNKNSGKADDGDVKMIHRNVRRLLNLVNQLLDFRKMEEHGLTLSQVEGDIIGFMIDAAESFRDIAAKKHIQLLINTSHTRWVTNFDHDKLERIIFNLLSNAFKFTGNGGSVILEINVDQKEEQTVLAFEVSDTGTGIIDSDIPRIFDRFFQAGQMGAVLNQGTGIGLAITKEFVELMDGHIEVESEIGKGTRFLVALPLPFTVQDEPIHPDLEIADAQVDGVTETQDSDLTTTILLVEDNDEFRSFLAEDLRKFYRVIEAANGKEGWQKALGTHPQLVVSDISMPLMNGIELSQKIKSDKRTSHIPVIILTAMTGEEEQLKGLQSGASDYLTKPFNFQILHTKIRNLLNLNQSLKKTYSKQIQMIGQKVEVESTDVKLLNNIMTYIETNLSHPELSVEDLSKHVGMSRGSLYYKVRELTGYTPIEYLRTVKLEKAAGLLESSNYNVAQVAYMTGFGTPSYFSRMFKAKYGILPSDYQNAKKNERQAVAHEGPVMVK